jgi:hypothetical protein
MEPAPRTTVMPDATYQDVLDAPPHLVAEVIDGRLYTQPRPARHRGGAGASLCTLLHGPFALGIDGPGGWFIYYEPELHLGPRPDILVPDLAGWRRGRLAGVADDAPFFTTPPDWACEIHSPRTKVLDRTRKMHIYAREGVEHLWLIDPDFRLIEVYRLVGGGWRHVVSVSGDEPVALEPFEAKPLEIRHLWTARGAS